MRLNELGFRVAAVSIASLCLLASCSEDIEGPAPALDAPSASAAPPPIDPEIVCRDQLTTEVTIHGERLSPLPIDLPDNPRTALPTVTLSRTHELDGGSVSSPDQVVYSGDPERDPSNAADDDGDPILVDGTPLLQWKGQEEMSFLVTQDLTLGPPDEEGRPQGMLEPGVWDVAVQNANGNRTESLGSLAVVDKPELAQVTPGIVCVEQGARMLELTGQSFLRNEGARAELAIEGLADPLRLELGGCMAIDHDGLDAEVCTSATAELAQGALDTGFPALTLENPETAACHSTEERNLRVVPPPSIERVQPPLACVAEEMRALVIEGSDFLRIDDTDPQVSIGGTDFAVDSMDGCEPLETQGHTVERCSSIAITVAMDALDPGLYDVTVANPSPAGCDATATGLVRIVPPPSIDEVEPALVCLEDGTRQVEVVGTDFLVVEGENPAVEVDGEALSADDVEAMGCADLPVDGLDVQVCETLVLTLDAAAVGLGMPAIRVENPDPAGCSDSRNDLLTVVEGPTVTSAEPALLCTVDGSKVVTITGTGFIVVDDELPAVRIDGDAVMSVDSADDCSAVTANGLDVQACTTLVVTVEQDALDEGQHAIVVQNPDPAGCAATLPDALTVPPLLAVSAIAPVNVCRDTVDPAFPITLTGAGFLDVDGALPTLTFDGASVTPALSDCTELEVAGDEPVSACTTLEATLALTASLTAAAGPLPITVENAQAPACALSVMTALTVVDPPMVTAIDIVDAPSDSEVCSDLGFTLTITGTGFIEGTTVVLVNEDEDFTTSGVVTVVSATELSAAFASGLGYNSDDSDYDLVVSTADDCSGPPLADAIDVNPTPLVFFVDPPVVYNAISLDVTVFAAGLSNDSALDSIEIIDSAGTATELTVVDNPKPSRIVANIPDTDPLTSQPYAPGDYTVRVTSVLGCAGELTDGLRLTDTLDAALLTSIAPSFVSPSAATAVTITGSGFLDVPRVYLSSGTGTATPLEAVEVRSPTELTAVVPGGVAAGSYDLIVVNPDGEVDVLADGLTVTAAEPPIVTSVVPASLPANSTGDIELAGSGFAAGAEVTLDCLVGTVHVPVAASAESVAVDGLSATATVSLATITAGSVCVVRLTNADGSFFDFSAFSVTNSSFNLSTWSPAEPLTVGRRGLATVAGRPTEASRFLYAIGGDVGAAGDPFARGTLHTSVEASSVDLFGVMGAWSAQRNDLSGVMIAGAASSEPRTQAGSVRIGRFAYLVGGHDGTSARDTLLRAQILDPTATPEIEELDAELGDTELGTGLGGGLYYYRVAAVFTSDDASNPGGESLGGELLPVQLPDRPEGIVLSLRWNAIAGAHGYRVYRSPMAGDGAGALELLGEVSCGALPSDACDCAGTPEHCQLTDDGTVATTAGQTPMPTGSLGAWHAVEGARCDDPSCALGTAREGLVTVAVRDRLETDTATDVYYLYAIGGRDGAGAYLDSVELATVTVTLATASTPESQLVGAFASAGDTLSSPRADLGAWVMNAENAAVIRGSGTPDDVWLYVGGGRTTGGTADRNMEAVLVGAGGALASFAGTDDLNGDLAGLGTGASNGQLYTFGGQTSSNGTSAALCAGGGGCSALPDLQPGAFNALGSAATDRMFMGHTQESAFFFLVGGHDGTTTLTTTEQTVQ